MSLRMQRCPCTVGRKSPWGVEKEKKSAFLPPCVLEEVLGNAAVGARDRGGIMTHSPCRWMMLLAILSFALTPVASRSRMWEGDFESKLNEALKKVHSLLESTRHPQVCPADIPDNGLGMPLLSGHRRATLHTLTHLDTPAFLTVTSVTICSTSSLFP